jgi:hypothetical protein
MNISALKKAKYKIILILGAITLIIIGIYLINNSSEEAPLNMDFSKKAVSSENENKKNNNIRKNNRIVKPDPAYKQAPEFEDFQAIAKMYVHAMKPFKKEIIEWETGIISLRLQRDNIKLYEDAALAAKGEADMYKYKNQSASYKSGKLFLDDNRDNNQNDYGSDDIVNLENVSQSKPITAEYTFSNIRMNLFAPSNKYSESSASFILGDEQFSSVNVNQVFASQFLVVSLNDISFCATIKDLNTETESRVCRN